MNARHDVNSNQYEVSEFHSKYWGYSIYKVTQPNVKRVTYDIYDLEGGMAAHAVESLRVAKAEILVMADQMG